MILAFLPFCLAASAGYLINDLKDVSSDRKHPTKCRRPFASGQLSPSMGVIGIVLLLSGAAALSSRLPSDFKWILAVYFFSSLLYSLTLKRKPIIDVLTLGGLYSIRILAGCIVINLAPSFWLLSFSLFFFFNLALVKRYAELLDLHNRGGSHAPGRGYQTGDLEIISTIGVASGHLSVLILAFYINSPEFDVLYTNPHGFWIICLFLLYWNARAWLLTHRGQMPQDPLIFAVKDPVSLALGALGLIAIFICR